MGILQFPSDANITQKNVISSRKKPLRRLNSALRIERNDVAQLAIDSNL